MFGKHMGLERKLRENGASATAEVLECRMTGSERSSTGRAVNVDDPRELWKASRVIYKLKLRVVPEGAPAWEVSVKCQLGRSVNARMGSQLPVLYDPDDHSKVVVDTETILKWQVAGAGSRDAGTEQIDSGMQAIAGDEAAAVMTGINAALASGDQISGVPPGIGAPDPLDRLQKLANLHQSGALTDAEFAAEKAKILSES